MKTVIIPAYNEEKTIGTCLAAILAQLEKKDEVIIIASGCTDKTIEKAKTFNDPRIGIIVQEKKTGKISALNLAIAKAKNNLLILSDADVIPEEGSIDKLTNILKQKKVGAVCAKIKNYKSVTFLDKVQNFGWKALHDQKVMENDNENFFALNGFLAGVKKEAVPKLDETLLVDDAILGYEVKKKGFQVKYVKEAEVTVKAAQNIHDYVNQKKRVRIGWWQMTKKGMKIKERRNIKQIRYLFTNLYAWPYVIFDIFIWILAYRDFKRKKLSWDQITSSKI